ncbi:MAG: hypothetical protein M0Z89_03285 [Nitrospiraceae bacterium]|nr:hypothetical protein [Nitrospiraceae bacterium]
MNKKTNMIVCVASAVLLVLSLHAAVYACQVDDYLIAKENTLAAATPDALNAAVASVQADQAKLSELLRAGTIIQIKEGTKVQVKERSFDWKMLKIVLPDGTASYWVKDGALKQIDCK